LMLILYREIFISEDAADNHRYTPFDPPERCRQMNALWMSRLLNHKLVGL
jgi:hypothetical protein